MLQNLTDHHQHRGDGAGDEEHDDDVGDDGDCNGDDDEEHDGDVGDDGDENDNAG